MNMRLYSILDSKAASFGVPHFSQTDSSAIRTFSDAVNDPSNPNNQWNRHPEDFSMYFVGEFDEETGELFPALPRSLVTASALKAVSTQPELFSKNGLDKVPIDA